MGRGRHPQRRTTTWRKEQAGDQKSAMSRKTLLAPIEISGRARLEDIGEED